MKKKASKQSKDRMKQVDETQDKALIKKSAKKMNKKGC